MLNQNLGKDNLANPPASCGLLEASPLHLTQAQSKEDQDPTGPQARAHPHSQERGTPQRASLLGFRQSSDNYRIEEMSH